MIQGGLEVDEGLLREARHGVEGRLGEITRQILALGEGADAERVAIGGERRDALAHGLGGGAVHHHARAGLELPAAAAGVDDERVAAEARHGRLEGGQRAQRGVEEQQREDPAGERARLGLLLQAPRELEEREHLLALEVREIDEALHGGRSRSASRSMSTCCSSRMNAGSRRRMCGSLAVPVRMQHSRSSAWISLAGRVVRSPTRSPAPWWAMTGPTMQVSRIYAPIRPTRSRRPWDLMAAFTAAIAAQPAVPPPKVVPRDSGLGEAATSGEKSSDAHGKPLPSALAVVSMSGRTP